MIKKSAKPLSKRNMRNAVLYALTAIVSVPLMRTVLAAILLGSIAIAYFLLARKAKERELALAEKAQMLEERMGDDLTDKERDFLQKYQMGSKPDEYEKMLAELSDDDFDYGEDDEDAEES